VTAASSQSTAQARPERRRRLLGWLRANAALLWLALLMCVLTVGVHPWSYEPEAAEHIAKTFAIVIGGLWVLYQFVLQRAFESKLDISVQVRSTPKASGHVVFIDVTLANVGNRRIEAPGTLTDCQQEEYEGSVKYPCDLQIRSIDDMTAQSNGYLDWWVPADEGTRVSVLAEYSTRDKKIDFFMEPGEKYSLGHVFFLAGGHYMAKVVFVGQRAGASEYWSQITYFYVPDSQAKDTDSRSPKSPQPTAGGVPPEGELPSDP
jgi:hypothetical protein